MRGIQRAQNSYGSPLRNLSAIFPYFLRFWVPQNHFSTFGDSTGLHVPHFGDFPPQNPKPSDFWQRLLPRLESAWFWGFPALALKLSTELSTTFGALWTTCGQLWISSASLRFSLFLQDFFFFPVVLKPPGCQQNVSINHLAGHCIAASGVLYALPAAARIFHGCRTIFCTVLFMGLTM